MLTWSTILLIAVKGLGMLHYTLIPSHCIQVDIERLLFSLAVKWHRFRGPKIDNKVIKSYTIIIIIHRLRSRRPQGFSMHDDHQQMRQSAVLALLLHYPKQSLYMIKVWGTWSTRSPFANGWNVQSISVVFRTWSMRFIFSMTL